ncbi:AAA family ATPase [Methanobrevibacter sp. OttesenSCG-928-K11]|nr:AAA family ATPase [Methanobrevibacter sp. OttesenSCG-928-K11]MDL2271217.1 AAA family ATPase [Methanobrevibacter sp. OttesenSCG-928-I08]
MMNIGIVYVKGSLPGFENFGNLPTSKIKSNGFVNGIKASKELDALIIPGGTLLESGDISDDLKKEINIIARDGKPVIGICAGFQVLANKTDIGRNSPCPIEKEGLGLIDVNFSPLITSDRVEAKVCNNSFLTNNLDETITGFHSHTYGKIEGNAKDLFYSKIKRMDYMDVNKDSKFNILSGAIGYEENVIGTLIHNILDENPSLVNNFLNFIDASDKDILEISSKNKEFKKSLFKNIGISSDINITNEFSKYKKSPNDYPNVLMIGSTGSDSGKTFITTGLAGALKRRGLNVGIIKIGPDVRDIIPGLYLTKGLMEDYFSVKIGTLGWMDIKDILENLKNSNYDIVLIEGVMSVFTGLLNEKTPYSASEIAASSNIPLVLVTGVNKGGIESASVDVIAHTNLLKKFDIDVEGIILNKVYNEDIFNNVEDFIKNETMVNNVLSIGKVNLDKRGATPETEINYDKFGKIALNTVEKYLNIEKIISMSRKPKFNRYLSFDEIKNKFL